MGIRRKKNDPLEKREKEIKSRLTEVHARIKQLSLELHNGSRTPQTTQTGSDYRSRPQNTPYPPQEDFIFEHVNSDRVRNLNSENTPAHFNHRGVRKFDPFNAWRRLKNLFRDTRPSNPQLVSFLAAGSIQGLRPLRYESRVARNRFIVLVLIFVVVLYGIFAFFTMR